MMRRVRSKKALSAGPSAEAFIKTSPNLPIPSALGIGRFGDVLMNASADGPALNAFLERTRRIMGYETAVQSKGPDALDALLLTIASPYRIGLLDLSDEGVLRALAVAELIVRKAW